MYTRVIDSNQCPKAHAHSGDIHGSKHYIVYIYIACECVSQIGRYLPAGLYMFTFRVRSER